LGWKEKGSKGGKERKGGRGDLSLGDLGGSRGGVGDVRLDPLGGNGFRALEGQGESAIPDERGENTESARDTEKNGVVLVLSHAVVDEQATRVGIHVGPGVLGLTVLGEDARGDFVDLGNELEEGIVGQVLEGKLALGHVARISLTQDSVTVARNDLTSVESIPKGLLDLIRSGVSGADLLLELNDPTQDLLVGETVERTSQTAHTGSEREIRIRQGRADQAGGVRRHVTSFMISVDHQIQTH